MTDSCLAIVLVHGTGAATHAEALRESLGAGRAVTSTEDIENGDLLLLDSIDEVEWIASNVILLDGNRAPIVRVLTLEEALA